MKSPTILLVVVFLLFSSNAAVGSRADRWKSTLNSLATTVSSTVESAATEALVAVTTPGDTSTTQTLPPESTELQSIADQVHAKFSQDLNFIRQGIHALQAIVSNPPKQIPTVVLYGTPAIGIVTLVLVVILFSVHQSRIGRVEALLGQRLEALDAALQAAVQASKQQHDSLVKLLTDRRLERDGSFDLERPATSNGAASAATAPLPANGGDPGDEPEVPANGGELRVGRGSPADDAKLQRVTSVSNMNYMKALNQEIQHIVTQAGKSEQNRLWIVEKVGPLVVSLEQLKQQKRANDITDRERASSGELKRQTLAQDKDIQDRKIAAMNDSNKARAAQATLQQIQTHAIYLIGLSLLAWGVSLSCTSRQLLADLVSQTTFGNFFLTYLVPSAFKNFVLVIIALVLFVIVVGLSYAIGWNAAIGALAIFAALIGGTVPLSEQLFLVGCVLIYILFNLFQVTSKRWIVVIMTLAIANGAIAGFNGWQLILDAI